MSSFKDTTWDVTDPVDQTSSGNIDLGYASNVDRSTILRNPQFLKDLQDRYDPNGIYSDDDLIEKFYSDENWAQLNTFGAVSRLVDGGGDTDEDKARNARLTNVWDNLPHFYQEGGRGVGALGDIAESVLLDPINVIGGLAGKAAARGSMRAATALGKPTPIKSTLKGVGTAAATEGAISGGQEALINVSEQSYRQDIGLQDEFSWGQFATATGFGTVLGGGVGGAIGIPSSIAGMRQGEFEAQELLNPRMMNDPEDIARLTNKQATEAMKETKTIGPMVPEGFVAKGADEITEVAEEPAPKTSTEKIIEELEAGNQVFQDQLEQARLAQEEFEAQGIKKGDATRSEVEAQVAEAEVNIDIVDRLKEEQAQIKVFLKDNSIPNQKKGRAMQALLDADVAKARVALKKGDRVTMKSIIDTAKARVDANKEKEVELQAKAETAKATTEKGTASPPNAEAGQATGGEPTISSQEGEPPVTIEVAETTSTPEQELSETPEPNWGKKGGGAGKASVDNQLAEAGLTPEQATDFLKENIANGKIPTTNAGVIKAGAPKAVRAILKETAPIKTPEGAMPKEEMPFGQVASNLASANQRITDPDEMRQVMIDQMKRNEPSKNQADIEKDYDELISGGEAQKAADDEIIRKIRLSDKEEVEMQRIVNELRQKEFDWQANLGPESFKNFADGEELLLNAKKMVLAKRAGRGVKSPRNVQAAIDRASILTTAGRTESGRIQSFLKWRSDRVGLDKSEQTFADNRMLDYGSAHAESMKRLKSKGDNVEQLRKQLDKVRNLDKKRTLENKIAQIESESVAVPFVSLKTTNNVYSMSPDGRLNAKTTFEKGSVLYADARNGKIFDSEYTADLVYHQKDIRRTGKSKVLDDQPLRKGNRILIIKKKDGTGAAPIRIMNTQQEARGEGLKEMLGNQKPEDWEVRYIDQELVTSRKQSILPELWEKATTPLDATDGKGVLRFEGDETGNGMATPIENLAESPVTEGELNPQQALAFKRGGMNETSTLADVQARIDEIERKGFSLAQTETDYAILISDLEQLYSIQRDKMPGGVVRKNAVREEATQRIEGIMSDTDPELVVAVKNMLSYMGGDQNKAPNIFRGSNEGSRGGGTWSYDKGKIIAVTGAKPDRDFFHSISQWAYDNILTPEDRMVFWNSIVQDISVKRGAGKTRTKKLSEEYGAEGSILPRQVFGDQFASWIMDNRTAGIFAKDLPNGKKMGAKVSEVLKGSIDRYFSKKEINPNLEPLFSKILPEEIRQMKKLGNISDKPQTKGGEVAKGFKAKLTMAKEDMVAAIRKNNSADPQDVGNPDSVLIAATNFRDLLGQAFAGRDIGGKSTAIAKTLKWLRPLDKMGRGRFADLNYILSGAALPDELKLTAEETSTLVQEGLSAGRRPESIEAQAHLIEELFEHGHAVNLKGGANARPYGGTKTEFTTLSELIRLMDEYTDTAYVEFEGKHLSNTSINLKTGEVIGKPDPAIKRRLNLKKNEDANAANEAEKVVKVTQKKRKSYYDPYKRMDYVTEATRVSYGSKSYKELLELFKKTKDTPLGDQIAWLMMSKKKAEPEPLKTKLSDFGKSTESSKLFNLQKPEILKLWKDGIRTGRFVHGGKEYPFSAIEWEVQRRGLVDRYKAGKKKPPVYLRQRIKTELNHGVGVATEDGIPPSAPIGAKTILSYMSHRDPEVQFTQRTMLYRMMNLMGKNVQNTLGETNVMDASDIARLAGDDPAGHKNVSVDFRGETFNKLRKNFRRMSIGLTKGNSNPFDAIHEIGHTIVRAGMLPKEEMDAVIELYKASDDAIKARVQKDYANKYDAPEAQQEQLLAEEWFAENLANYLGERTMRGDVLKAMSGGNLDNLRLKNSFERAFDRIVELVSYVVNGLIGRKDIKQQFRRLTIYGDMLEETGKSPLVRTSVKEPAISPAYVNAYASDVLRQSKPSKKAAVHKYNGGGKFSVREDGTPIVYYHATPNGGAFKNSQVVMEQGGGLAGPGIYISPNSRAVEMIYGNRPTMGAIERLIRDKAPDLGEEKAESLVYEAMDLHDLRVEISLARRKLAEAADDVEMHNDEVMHFQNAMGGELDEASISSLNRELKTKQEHESDLRNTLTAMLEKEDAVMAEFDQQGVNFEPTVLPLVTRMLNTFDLGKGVTHKLNDPQIQSILRSVYKITNNFEGGDKAFADEVMLDWWPETGLRGIEVYEKLYSYVNNGMDGFGAEAVDNAQAILNQAIEDAGFDSMKVPHQNRMTPTDTTPEDAIRGELMEYDAFVVFNPEGVKHVNAEFFDAEDARLYYRDFGKTGQGFNGSVVKAMADGETSKLDTSNTIQMLEAIEDEGVSAPMVDAMSSILRSRDFTPIQEQAVRKQGPMAWLTSQSDRMERMGMNWLGSWYKDHFPNQHQTFASKYMPIHNLLRGLPGAHGKVRAWARSASASIGQKQPQAYSNIVSALRHGDGSRQWNRLTPSEKSVAEKIKDEFNKERQRMLEAGMFVGYRRNYVPQIWNKDRIQKNREGFLAGMRSYYGQEQTSLGNTFQSADADAFAEKVYQSLTRESVDGVQVPESPKSPIKGSTKNPRAESLDFNRVIELEKYPAAMKEMEKFLEDDLEFMLVKYFEGSTRRTLHAEKFGLNSHGVDDYLYVTENGSRGIAKLLSTNKVYQKDFRSVTSDGVEEGVLRSETVMPFHNDEAGAVRFADELVEIAQTHGSPAVRQKLESISVGDINPTYRARIEAIVGALEDHKGIRTRMETDDARFIENSMRVARKDSLNDFGGKAGLRASRALRTFNNVTLLGFTTLTSLGDLVLPIIRSGSFTDWTKSVYQLATDPDYRRALKEVGIAMENITHERMLNMYGAADSKLSNAFFNATMLTPWTDMNRQVAGALGHQTFITHQRKALRSYIPGKPVSEQPRDYKIAYRYMKNFGLQEYLEGGTKSKISLSDTSLMSKDENLRKAMIRFADESIFQPNANDTPMFAQTPLGALAFQLKSFPLMMTRLAGHVIREANLSKLLKGDASESNIKPLLYFASLGPAFGMGALAAKDIVQMRGGEDEQSPALRIRNAMKTLGYDEKIHGNEVDFWGWYMEGMLQMGGVGLLGDILHSAVTQADNGSYGQTRFLQTLGGPSVGLVTGGLSVLGGTQDAIFGTTDSNSKERTALREVATRIPVVGGIKRAREGIVNMIGGEASGGGSSGWGKGWEGSWN